MTRAILSSLLVALPCASCRLTAIPEEMLTGGPTDASSVADVVSDAAHGDAMQIDAALTDATAADGRRPDAVATDQATREGAVATWSAKTKRLVELQPDNWQAQLMLSHALSHQEQQDAALAAAKKATALNPTAGAAWNQLGYAFVALKRSDDAIAAFRKYVEVAPTEPNAHDSLAEALFDANRLDEAEAGYRKAIEVSAGKFYPLWSGVAAIRCLKADWKGCREALAKQRAGETSVERRAGIDLAVAWSYAAEGKAKEALRTLDIAETEYTMVKSGPAVTSIISERAWMLCLLGRHAEAVKAADATDKGDMLAMPESSQRATRIGMAVVRAVALARSARAGDAEKALTAVDADVKQVTADQWLQSQLAMGRAEIALANKDFKAAVQQLSMCPETMSYCRWQLSLAQEKSGDQEAARLTRDNVLAHPRRSPFYVWVRNQIASKKVTKEKTAATDEPATKQ